MRMFKMIAPVALAFMMMAGTGLSIASAQSDPTDPFADFEGIEKFYTRLFTADVMAMMNLENPDVPPTGWFSLGVLVLEFDDADNATSGLEQTVGEIEDAGVFPEGSTTENVELDLDFEYTAQAVEDTTEGVTTNLLQVAAQDEEYVYIVVGVTLGEDPTSLVESTISSVKNAEVSDDEETFAADGTSEGGLWAKFPTPDVVSGEVESLTEAADQTYFPEEQGGLTADSVSTPADAPIQESTPAN